MADSLAKLQALKHLLMEDAYYPQLMRRSPILKQLLEDIDEHEPVETIVSGNVSAQPLPSDSNEGFCPAILLAGFMKLDNNQIHNMLNLCAVSPDERSTSKEENIKTLIANILYMVIQTHQGVINVDDNDDDDSTAVGEEELHEDEEEDPLDSSTAFILKVNIKDKDPLELTVSPHFSIKTVMMMIRHKLGHFNMEGRLVLNGKDISVEPYRRIAEYGIQKMDHYVLAYVIMLRGGGKTAPKLDKKKKIDVSRLEVKDIINKVTVLAATNELAKTVRESLKQFSDVAEDDKNPFKEYLSKNTTTVKIMAELQTAMAMGHHDTRMKGLAKACFPREWAQLEEAKDALQLIENGVVGCIMELYCAENGEMKWKLFMEIFQKIMTKKLEAQTLTRKKQESSLSPLREKICPTVSPSGDKIGFRCCFPDIPEQG